MLVAVRTASSPENRMNYKIKTQEIIRGKYRHALFYRFPGGLRYALSEGGSPLDMALSALRKATIVCDDVFAGEESILVHLMAYAPASRFGSRTMLKELRVAGVAVPRKREVWFDKHEAGDGDEIVIHCAFEVPVAKLQNLLWCAITLDLYPLSPRPHCRVYLLNTNKGIVAHAYDDRGMDVVSLNKPALAGLYQRHHHLLHDHDMVAMRESFGPL